MKKILREWDSWLIACLLTALAALMLAEAARRHLWPGAPAMTVKTAAGCLAWLVSIGMAKAAEMGLHIRVGAALPALPAGWRSRAETLGEILFLFFCLASFVVGCLVLYRTLAPDRKYADALICLAIPVGSVLTMFRLVERLLILNSPDAAEKESLDKADDDDV